MLLIIFLRKNRTFNNFKTYEMGKVRILHIIKDDKFFDPVIAAFRSDERLEHICALYSEEEKNYRLKYVHNTDNLYIYNRRHLYSFLQTGMYDVIFFFSLQVERYKLFNYIPTDKIIIWWCWGTELYSGDYGLKPLIPIELYKRQTLAFVKKKNQSFNGLIRHVVNSMIRRFYYSALRKKALGRIDYFQPVLKQEYRMMQSYKYFHAKEFYYPQCFNYTIIHNPPIASGQGVLIGNSASATNNHVDLWIQVKNHIPTGRRIIIPVAYGYKDYSNYIQSKIHSNMHEIVFMKDFLSQKEYFEIVNTCSYAIFGMMRQQAMGNIYHCLFKGIKIFLYKDSLIYRFLIEDGFIVFAIEEIDNESFITPLTKEEHEKNLTQIKKKQLYVKKISDFAICEIINKIQRHNMIQ